MQGSKVEASLFDDHLSEDLLVKDKSPLLDERFEPTLVGHFRLYAINDVEEDVFTNLLVDFFDGFYLFLVVKTVEVGEFFHHFEELVGHKAAHLLKERKKVLVIGFDERMGFVAAFLE